MTRVLAALAITFALAGCNSVYLGNATAVTPLSGQYSVTDLEIGQVKKHKAAPKPVPVP